jgi:hypothetical protein
MRDVKARGQRELLALLKGTLSMIKGVLVNYGSIDYKLGDCSAASGSRLLLLLSGNNGSNGSFAVWDSPVERDWISGVQAVQAVGQVSTVSFDYTFWLIR